MTRMLLVRHAQSEWNAQGRWQGRADPPLSDLGLVQARQAAERVGTVDVIVTSPLQRALVTAELISDELGVGPVHVELGLAERDVGEWSGLTRDQIEEGWPGYLDSGRKPPGFEGDESVIARTTDALSRLERQHRGAEVLIITHGGVIYVLEQHHGERYERIPNLGARQLAHHGERTELGKRLHLVDPLIESSPSGM